jgi:hypothetical protein
MLFNLFTIDMIEKVVMLSQFVMEKVHKDSAITYEAARHERVGEIVDGHSMVVEAKSFVDI